MADEDQKVIKSLFLRQIAAIDDEPVAFDLLRVLSYLDTSNIPISMLQNAAIFSDSQSGIKTAISERIERLLDSPPRLMGILRRLANQNLLNLISGTLRIHDLTCFMIQQS